MKNLSFFILLCFLCSSVSVFAQSFRPTKLEYGRGIYCAKQGAYYAFEADYLSPSNIQVVDEVYGKLIKNIRVDSIPYAPTLSPDEQYIYFAAQYPGRIRRVHLASDQVETVLVLPDSIQNIQGLQVMPGHPDQFLLTYTGPQGSGISLFEGKKLLAHNQKAFYANNHLQIQNDSTFFVFTGQQQVLTRGVIQKDTILLRDTFPEWSTANLGFMHHIEQDTFYAANGMVLKLGLDSVRLLKTIPDVLPSFHHTNLVIRPGLSKWYVVETFSNEYKFIKIDKRSLKVDSIWTVRRPDILFGSFIYVMGLREDAFVLSAQYATYLYWNCKAETPEPALVGGPEIYPCRSLSNTATIQAKDLVPEYLWSTGATTSALTLSESTGLQLQYGDHKGCLTPLSAINQILFIGVAPPPSVNDASGAFSVQVCRKQSIQLQARDFSALRYEWSTGATSQSIQVSTEGTFRVRSFDRYGCPSLWSLGTRVEVIPDTIPAIPTIQSTKGGFSFCTGEVAELTLPPGYNYYLWQGQKTSSPTWKVSSSTSIYVKIGHDARCLSDWATAEVRFYPIPKQPVIQRIGDVLATNNAGETHLWYRNNELIAGASTQFLTITQNGEYLVRTVANACTSPYSSSVVVQDIVTSLQEINNSTIKVYPNPASEELFISSTLPQSDLWTYQIKGIDGRIQQQGTVSKTQRITVNQLPQGVFVLSLWQDRQHLGLLRFIKH